MRKKMIRDNIPNNWPNAITKRDGTVLIMICRMYLYLSNEMNPLNTNCLMRTLPFHLCVCVFFHIFFFWWARQFQSELPQVVKCLQWILERCRWACSMRRDINDISVHRRHLCRSHSCLILYRDEISGLEQMKFLPRQTVSYALNLSRKDETKEKRHWHPILWFECDDGTTTKWICTLLRFNIFFYFISCSSRLASPTFSHVANDVTNSSWFQFEFVCRFKLKIICIELNSALCYSQRILY